MMRKCILCGQETKGSIGAARIKWTIICQPCKDREDKALAEKIRLDAKMFDSRLIKFLKEVSQ